MRGNRLYSIMVVAVLAVVVMFNFVGTADAQEVTLKSPVPPVGLEAVSANGEVTLTWRSFEFEERPIDHHVVERAEYVPFPDPVFFEVFSPASSWVDTSARLRTRYTYRVKAVNSVGSSRWSNSRSVWVLGGSTTPTEPPAAPGSPRASFIPQGDNTGSIVVNWAMSPRSQDVQQWNIWQNRPLLADPDPDEPPYYERIETNTNTFTVDVEQGYYPQVYKYQVSAVNAAG